MNRPALVALLALSGCAAGQEGRYLGTVTPTQPGPLCQPTKATLQIRGTAVLFAPDEGTWLLEGQIAADGAISAAKSRLAANKQPFDTVLEAKAANDTITGTYRTPRCIAAVALSRR